MKSLGKNFLYLGLALVFGYTPSHAALEMYADFETVGTVVRPLGPTRVNGTFTGGKPPSFIDGAPPQLSSRGKKALRLPGKGFVFFREYHSPELDEAWSINVFAKFDTGVRGLQTVVGRPGSWFWYVDTTQNTARFSPSRKDPLTFPLPTGLAGKWSMLTLVKSGNSLELLVDGESRGTQNLADPLEPFGPLYVGAASSSAGYGAQAAIDDLSIWSQALTTAEIQKLLSGSTAVEVVSEGRLQRKPTTPITAQTPIYETRKTLDARQAVIALPERGNPELAEKIRDALSRAWGVQLKIRPVDHHSDGNENVILLGAGMEHPLSRELAGNQQIQRNLKGSELRILPDALDWRRGVIYLGGRDETEVLAAAQELVNRFPKPDNLPFTIHAQAPENLRPPADFVKKARALYAARKARQNSLVVREHLQPVYELYLATGDTRYEEALIELFGIMAKNYRNSKIANNELPPTFEFHRFAHYLYLLEQSPNFSDDDRRQAAELMRQVSEDTMDCWEMVPPAEAYSFGKQKYFTNHYMFASRTVGNSVRYLMSRYGMPELQYFLAVAENTIDAAKEVPLSPEDAGGYQYLVYRIYTDYMLGAGKLDSTIFTNPKYIHYMDYAKMTVNHLGYTPGYGDANAIGSRGPFLSLHENMEFTGDPESAAILALIGRSDGSYYKRRVQEWGIPLDLPLPADPRFLGLRVFTVDQARAQIIGLTSSRLPKLDKAIFRSSWERDSGEFLALNGLNSAPHGHDDAIGVSQYVVGQHLWLTEGDYIRRTAEYHNLVSVIRDGEAAKRQWKRIPNIEQFAQVVGETQSRDRKSAALSLLLERNNGVNYYRHIGWETGGGFWVIDELEAVEPGDYRFASRWRTTGKVQPTAQGVLVEQKPASEDDQLYHFSIAEGTGATRLGYSEFERSHGRGAGNLIYNLSDRVTRTVLFWKDAKLKAGERVFFANYFRAVPGSDPQPVAVEKLGENAFAAGAGEDRRIAIIGEFGGISARAVFAGPAGILAVEPQTGSAELVSQIRSQSGSVVENELPSLPENLPAEKLEPLHRFDAEVSYTASGENHVAVGLANGGFYLFNPDGSEQAKVALPGEISSIGSVNAPGGELWAVGTRPRRNAHEAAGSFHLIDATGKIRWSREFPGGRGRQGAVTTIFPAHLDGPEKPVSIVLGAEPFRFAAYDLEGNERWIREQSIHAAMNGAAGDLDGDGRDEIFTGSEYFVHPILSPEGKKIEENTTAAGNLTVLIGDPDQRGINRVFSARPDGFLYSESLDSQKARNWSANLGGPAHGIAFLDSRVVAATLNGGITRIDANGKRTGFTQLPAPLTHIQLLRNALFAPGLDGRVYQVNAKTLELVKAWETNGYSESNRHFPTLLSTGDSLFATFGKQIYRVE